MFHTIKFPASLIKINMNFQDISLFRGKKKISSIRIDTVLAEISCSYSISFSFRFIKFSLCRWGKRKRPQKMSSVFLYSLYFLIKAVAITLVNISNYIFLEPRKSSTETETNIYVYILFLRPLVKDRVRKWVAFFHRRV